LLTEAAAADFVVSGTAPAGSIAGPSPYEFRSLLGSGANGAPRDFRLDAAGSDETSSAILELARRDAFEDGRREGEHAARIAAEAANAASLAHERAGIVAAVHAFRDTRNQYFSGMEHEVVRLALAIAARVLHREVQLDPLLLAGVARVALDKLADRSGVTLRVSAKHFAEWQKAFESVDTPERPAITADLSLAPSACVLETRMGTVELGIAAQLEEIERGFFDLLSQKPVS
jgi:flagellar assembly protein FliH